MIRFIFPPMNKSSKKTLSSHSFMMSGSQVETRRVVEGVAPLFRAKNERWSKLKELGATERGRGNDAKSIVVNLAEERSYST